MKFYRIARLIAAFLFLLSFLSCHESRLRKALRYSGENREELERVIEYFSADPGDSLKLKAAIFLIENMPGHYSFFGEETAPFFEEMNTNYPGMQNHVRIALSCLPQYYVDPAGGSFEEDIKTIKSGFLIEHIEKCFDNHRAVPWGGDIPFDVFCKYVLPYRIDNEPLEEIISHTYRIPMDSMLQSIKDYNLSTFQAAGYLQNKIFTHSGVFRLRYMAGVSEIFDCLRDSYIAVAKNRSMSIPAAFDFTPHWPDRNGRHYWHRVIHPFLKSDTTKISDLTKFAKVYRISYHHNEIPEKDGENYIPELFRYPFHEDVTGEYAQTSDVTVKIGNIKGHRPKYAYLFVFNESQWKPVDWGRLKNGKALFEKTGRGNVYLPAYYVKDELFYAGYPFLLDGSGRIRHFVPDKSRQVSLRLNRKYPMHRDKLLWSASMQGVMVAASDDISFSKCDTLAFIDKERLDSQYDLNVNSEKAYRYLRLGRIASSRPVEIAELTLYDREGNIVPVESTNIIQRGMYENENMMFDNNPLSYIATRGYLYLDLGKPATVSGISIMTRNDDNYIVPGERYELLYMDMSGWVPVGAKTATDNVITFDGVPEGALYWLRNLTKGREERIFSYENGTQVWW